MSGLLFTKYSKSCPIDHLNAGCLLEMNRLLKYSFFSINDRAPNTHRTGSIMVISDNDSE